MNIISRSFLRVLLACIIILVNTSPLILSQEPVTIVKSTNKVMIEGRVYFVHVVKPGNTLYSIAKAYNVSENEIIEENPGSSQDLRIGQVLKIPEKVTTAAVQNIVKPETDKNTHTVQHGETIYSISRLHNCTVDAILQLNPGLVIEDIQIGQALRIPGEIVVEESQPQDEQHFIYHKVKKRETFYSISKAYGVSISEIKEYNDEIGWGGPRTGDILRIPKPRPVIDVMFRSDTLIRDTVDLLLSDSIIQEEYRYEELIGEYPFWDKTYNIAYLIPFDFKKQEPIDSLLKDIKSPVRRERIIEQYQLEETTPQSIQFLEFMEGSLLAIDSLTDAGLKVDIHFFDTRKSMYRTREILALDEMKDMDLIIGPFYTYNLELASDFCMENHIPLVTPFHSDDSIAFHNPYVFQITPSYKTEYEKNVKFLTRSYKDNLIFLHSGDSAVTDKTTYYKKLLLNELRKKSDMDSLIFDEVILKEGNMEPLIAALLPGKRNTIILPATDEAFSSQVASTLYYKLEEFDIQIYGSPYWVGFDDIETEYIHKLHLNVSHTHIYNYQDPVFLGMLKKFRQNYFNEPGSKTRMGVNFGMLGYDISLYFLSALKEFGPRFILNLDEYNPSGMLTDFKFVRLSPSGGYENESLKYYSFDKDMKVYEIKLPEMPEIRDNQYPATKMESDSLWRDTE